MKKNRVIEFLDDKNRIIKCTFDPTGILLNPLGINLNKLKLLK
jgi:hypothetical protein